MPIHFLQIQFRGNRRLKFTNDEQLPFRLGDWAVVETEKGEDMGRVVHIGSVDSANALPQDIRRVIRRAGSFEITRQKKMEERTDRAESVATSFITRHRLPMNLVDTEYQLDGRKVTFYFTADGRVDFRNLVRDLAAELRTRIDLRQIGPRDEFKRTTSYGICGHRLCCSSFLSGFDPITTQIAKTQNLSLNPSKLSGACGRLRCCLRYEYDLYRDQMKAFPRVDSVVLTSRGLALVEKVDIFGNQVMIQFEDGDEEMITRDQMNHLMKDQDQKLDTPEIKQRIRALKQSRSNGEPSIRDLEDDVNDRPNHPSHHKTSRRK